MANRDYIFNIRISKETYEKVRREAKENAESISNLLRKVINDGLDIASSVSSEFRDKENKFKNIVSYYNVKLARDIPCSRCGTIIKSSKDATVGETNSGRKYYFCARCK